MAAAIVSTFLLGQAANAQPTTPIVPLDTAPRQFYVTLDADYGGVPRSNFTYLETCPMDGPRANLGDCVNGSKNTPYLDASKQIDSFGGGGTFGYTLPTSWWGKRQRLELGFNYLSGERSDGRSGVIAGESPYVPGTSELLLLIGIDGGSLQRCGNLAAPLPGCSGSDKHFALYNNDDNLDITSSVKTKYNEWNLVERVLLDFDIGRSMTLTSNAGLIFRQNTTTIRAKASWVDSTLLGGGGDTVLSSLYEQIKSRDLGIELGSIVSYDLYSAIKLFGGVNLEILHKDGSLEGHDCLSREYGGGDPGPVPAACVYDPSDPVDEAGFKTHVSKSKSDTAINVALSIGGTYAFNDGITVGLTGFANNVDRFYVFNPSHPHTDDNAPYAPAQLKQDREWLPGAQLSLTVPFGALH